MMRSLVVFSVMVGVACAIWLANLRFEDLSLDKLLYTVVAVAVCYFIFHILLEGLLAKRIRDLKARYSFRKTMGILFLVVSCIVILRIWIINPQALLVAYGLVAAGVAISLQDLFKNFAGSIVIFLTGLFQVGHRIEVDGKFGDVIDIGMLYTTILELREWVHGDQATGRLSLIPNGIVLSHVVNNYTKDNHFMWDEIQIPVTYESAWQDVATMMRDVTARELGNLVEEAQKNMSRLQERYFLSNRSMEPATYFEATDNWMMVTLRYVVDVRDRRTIHSKLTSQIVELIQQNSRVQIASTSVTVTDTRKNV